MKHFSDHETHDMASAYALGSLNQPDAESFEQHLAEGCEPCRELLQELDAIVGQLGFSAPAVTSSPTVRDRLMNAVKNESSERPAISAVPYQSDIQRITIRADEGDWTPLCEGVTIKQLFADPVRNTVSFLVKMSSGSEIAKHHHPGIEECLMLQGELYSGNETLSAGDYQVNMAGTDHDKIETVNGALLLIVRPAH